MQLIHRVGGCENGTCPNFFDVVERPDLVAVQGTTLVDGEALEQLSQMPGGESVVLIPRGLLDEYARTKGWQPE